MSIATTAIEMAEAAPSQLHVHCYRMFGSFDDALMEDGRRRGRLSLLRRPPQPAFERRLVELAPRTARIYDGSEWTDAIVVVERGEIELEGLHGGRITFTRGDVLFLVGLPLRALRNRCPVQVVLSAVSRRH